MNEINLLINFMPRSMRCTMIGVPSRRHFRSIGTEQAETKEGRFIQTIFYLRLVVGVGQKMKKNRNDVSNGTIIAARGINLIRQSSTTR